jgi:hypothetical protein
VGRSVLTATDAAAARTAIGAAASGGTHSSGTLAARPASPAAGDTYAVTSGAQTGARYVCFVSGTWQAVPAPGALWADGTDPDDVLVIVPDSPTWGDTTFTDLTGRHTVTATRAYHDPFRGGRVGRSACQLGRSPFEAGAGALLVPQSDDFAFPAYSAGTPHASDFTIEALVTIFQMGGLQRVFAQGRLEGGAKRWCFGFNGGNVNFALNGHAVETTIDGTYLPASALGQPILCAVTRSAGTLYLFVAGEQVGTATYTEAVGVPVSGSPAAADALIFGARDPASFYEPLVGGLIHAVRVSKVCRYTTIYTP